MVFVASIATIDFRVRDCFTHSYCKIAFGVDLVDLGPHYCQSVDCRVAERAGRDHDCSDEQTVVGAAYAQVQPHAVVVELVYADSALVAMLSRRLDLDLAVGAKIVSVLARPSLCRKWRLFYRRHQEAD
jgi:hypothetical protein